MDDCQHGPGFICRNCRWEVWMKWATEAVPPDRFTRCEHGLYLFDCARCN